MKIEMLEETSRSQSTSKLEPRIDVLHGPPGTGKSLVLALLKELFAVLEWSMGTQFILLAFLNSVAAACGGETVHHWSGIPLMPNEAKICFEAASHARYSFGRVSHDKR